MTDVLPHVLPPESEQQRAAILDEMRRELYDALPHEYNADLVDGALHLMSPSGTVNELVG